MAPNSSRNVNALTRYSGDNAAAAGIRSDTNSDWVANAASEINATD
jgi:hypothetical protein